MAGAWLLLLVALVTIADRATVTGPAGMSLPRAIFFVANAASLSGFDTTWAAPQRLTPTHAAIWIVTLSGTALLSLIIAIAAFARASRQCWTWRRIYSTAAIFLLVAFALASAAELIAGRNILASLWNGLMIATGTGALIDSPSHASSSLWLFRFPLTALAAIGPFILIDTLGRRRGPMSRISRLTWMAVPASFVAAVGLLMMVESLTLDLESPVVAIDPIARAATAAIDARGAGFTESAATLSPPARWALVPVLLLGGASGGIGGGLKALTAAVLVLGIIRLLRGGSAGRTFAMAALWLGALAALWFASFLLLMHFSPQLRADRAAILTAGAWGGAGVSVDPVGATGADAYVLAGAMLLGRVLPWIVLWWSATRGDEDVAIG